MCYNMNYVEKNEHKRGGPWSLRELGVYHKFDLETRRSRWIFIQTRQAANGILEHLQNNSGLNPLYLHVLLLRSMSMHWPEYIDYLDSKIEPLVGILQ